ncbi:succinyldiaminopimelate transaminase [Uliginosibacterium sediminicola]|uniref:Succinyldiaminopimelate transaminase n=1 Tax=Uliginosibacterium sediminicola TaxID=2024550 RepID=A0ABU9Z0G1_9RHOO
MNPLLDQLHPYPFEKLRALFAGTQPPALPPIRLSIGEPQHEAPQRVKQALIDSLGGLSIYPTTIGIDALRESIAAWLQRRFGLKEISAGSQVLPVNGTREALFAFAQCVVDASRPAPLVASPNPFYQIYEGAALLAGAQPLFLNQSAANGFGLDLDGPSAEQWARVQLLYVCSPGNPTGRVLSLDEWRDLFALADRYGFIIAADECYSEIYFDEAKPPLGALQAAQQLGRSNYERLVVFHSLSKRSNVPGLRSGFVAGDAAILKKFLLYRTYHGCAMSQSVQLASIAAWNDETHVQENRVLYREKFDQLVPMLSPVLGVSKPDAGFYLWARTPVDDAQFARVLFAQTHVTVLPGQYLAREARGLNPGHGFVRIALVAGVEECVSAAQRIVEFCQSGKF